MSSYVKRILGLVGSRNPVELMRESRVAIEAAMRSIDSSNSFDVAYGDDKWTAREVICHLADVGQRHESFPADRERERELIVPDRKSVV